jgi:hypothetical protein
MLQSYLPLSTRRRFAPQQAQKIGGRVLDMRRAFPWIARPNVAWKEEK